MVASMRVPLIAALLISHGAVAYIPMETVDDVSTYSDRHSALQRTRTSLDSLMSRADEKILSTNNIESQPGPPERSEFQSRSTGRQPLANTIPPSKSSKDGFCTLPISTLIHTISAEAALTRDVTGDPKMTLWPIV
jgi:hypothetical protein